MSPSARRAGASRLRKSAHATTKNINNLGEGVPNLQLTEAQWQARVISLAKFYGWRLFHPPDNVPTLRLSGAERLLRDNPQMSGRKLVEQLKRQERRQHVEPGFPDLVLTRVENAAELLFAELKTETGRLGPGQAEWGEDLTRLGDDVAVCLDAARDPSLMYEPPSVAVEHHLWRPSMEDAVHERLRMGRGRVEPAWFVGEL